MVHVAAVAAVAAVTQEIMAARVDVVLRMVAMAPEVAAAVMPAVVAAVGQLTALCTGAQLQMARKRFWAEAHPPVLKVVLGVGVVMAVVVVIHKWLSGKLGAALSIYCRHDRCQWLDSSPRRQWR